MPRKYVVVTMQRSGSNMLGDILDEHPEVACFGELMRPTPHWMRTRGYRGALKVLRDVNPAFRLDRIRFAFPYVFVDRVYRHKRARDKGVVGFKLHIGQHERFMRRLIEDPDYALIVLQRDNILAQYSSSLIAEETGQGNARKGDQIKRARVTFSASGFRNYVRRVERDFDRTRQLVESSGKFPFELRYTELNDTGRLREMMNFLAVDPSVVPEPNTEKRNSSDIVSRFSNPEVVTATLEEMGRQDWAYERS